MNNVEIKIDRFRIYKDEEVETHEIKVDKDDILFEMERKGYNDISSISITDINVCAINHVAGNKIRKGYESLLPESSNKYTCNLQNGDNAIVEIGIEFMFENEIESEQLLYETSFSY